MEDSAEKLLQLPFERYIELRVGQDPCLLDAQVYLADTVKLASKLENHTSIIFDVRSEAVQRLNKLVDKAEELSKSNDFEKAINLLNSAYLLLSAALSEKDGLNSVLAEVPKDR